MDMMIGYNGEQNSSKKVVKLITWKILIEKQV